jgi:hypothetical protein
LVSIPDELTFGFLDIPEEIANLYDIEPGYYWVL